MKKFSISLRAITAPSSPVRMLVPLSDQAKKRGLHIYHINIGDPDFEIPKAIKNELQKVAKRIRHIPYANSKGLKSVIDGWIKYYHDVGISLSQEDIVITSGGSEALILASAITLDPGDKFIVFEPFYANYNSFGNLVSAKPIPIALDHMKGYHLPSDDEIQKKITTRTKAIFFTNPNNPTGTVFTKEEVQRIVKIAAKNNVFLIADETYRDMCFDDKEMVSVMDVATAKEKQYIILTDSVSKRCSVPGTRVGAIISKNKKVMEAAFRFAQGRLSVSSIEQEIMAPMLYNSLPYLQWITSQYEKRRNAFIGELEKYLKIKIHRPEGAFYTMLQLPVKDTEDFAKWLLTDFSDNKETVMVAPGSGFYATAGKGMREVRVAFVLDEKKLKRAAQLLALGLEKYKLIHK